MDNLVLTIIFSLILMVLVIAGLAAGLLLTGKSRLRRGCGYVPDTKKNKKETSTSNSCPLCGENEKCQKKEKTQDEHDH